jgi:hypothetical protein
LVYGLWRSLRTRSIAMRALSGPLTAGHIADRAPGTAGQIADAGAVPAQALLGALAVRAQTDADADKDDEGHGDLLGLTYHRWKHLGDDWWEPVVYDGTRAGRQVWIRLGRDGGSLRGPGANARRLRALVAVRAAVPAFELTAKDGRLVLVSGGTEKLAAVLELLATSPDVWRDLRVVGGAEGIVASRGVAQDFVGGWIYDLWLLEHTVAFFDGTPLAPVQLGREWTPPYGLGSWAPSLVAALTGA